MTKTMKSRLALLLALAMMVCLLAVPAAAEDNAPNEYGIKTYVALGDSIATGLNDNTGTNEDAYGSWENGYTVKLAEKLGLLEGTPSYEPEGYNGAVYYKSPNKTGFRPWSFPAMRTLVIRHQVDADYHYEMDRFAEYWLDNGELYQEYTLVVYLSDTTLEAVHSAADELISLFHQSSILIQQNPTTTEFYSPAK